MDNSVVAHLTGGSRHKRDGRSIHDRLRLAEQMLDLRNQGMKVAQIAEQYGLGNRTVDRYINLALAQRTALNVDLFRAQANDRMDMTQREISVNMNVADKLLEDASIRGDRNGIARAVDLRTKQIALQIALENRRAGLNGLDMKNREEVTESPEMALPPEVLEVQRAAQERARAIRAEAAIYRAGAAGGPTVVDGEVEP